ncbi:USP6 N-terminal-like protein [Vulpes lagopus]
MDAGDPRDKELPSPSPREAKKLRQETRRVDKWIKMLKRWDHYLPSENLRRRVYKEVPPQVRGQVWLRLLNIDQVKARNAGKYQEMKEAALVSSRDIVQIDLDVNRTFRSHTMFWDRYGVGLLGDDTEVGYCQGMSEIEAILMFLPEEDAFWALAQLMVGDRHSMHRASSSRASRSSSRSRLIMSTSSKALPDLSKHMDEEQMSTGIYSPKWFMQCFLGRTPFSLTLKLWDAYVLDGEGAHGHGLHHPQERLLKLPLEGLREFLQDSLAQPWALEDEAVLRHLRSSMTQLQRMRCDLPPPGPEEFSTRPLGLEPVSPAPGPLLPSLASETPPRVEEPASPGPAARPEPPDPLPARPSSNFPPSDGTPFPSSQCNKTVQAGGPQIWA